MNSKKYHNLIFIYLFCQGSLFSQPNIPSICVNIKDFGASQQIHDNAIFIQHAIDESAGKGGGKVIIPEGVFMCGPLSLKSNTEIYLSENAVLRMLPYGNGNGILPGSYPNDGNPGVYPSLISAKNIQNARISGYGTLDGQGNDWWAAFLKSKQEKSLMKRGCLIALIASENIEISGIKLLNGPNVHLAIGKKCARVIIDGISIECPEDGPNTDGIDVWGRDVVIKNCRISCGDDNIAMDTGTKNIIIKNCYFGTGHGCSIGSYSHDIQNVLVDSCVFDGTDTAIRMKSSRQRGGGERNIVYSNIKARNVKCAVYISSYYPKAPKNIEDDLPVAVTENTPSWSDITIKNLDVESINQSIEIWGLPEMPVQKVNFENVKIRSKKGIILNNVSEINFKNSVIINSENVAVKMYNAVAVDGLDLKTGLSNHTIK